jgi:5-methyltetrahydropteroyltriglutamate--homocysteine methyltransferase
MIPRGKTAVLGVMSTKVRDLETVDAIRRKVDEAAKHKDMDDLGICPQCCFASGFQSDRFTGQDQEQAPAAARGVQSDLGLRALSMPEGICRIA